jgi:nicotinamide-nucleotide amidase
MKAAILAIGSELVHGEKLDTNSQWMASRLADLGIDTRTFAEVGDDLSEIVDLLRYLGERHSLVIVGGGLGPTQDDLTREALAAIADVPLIEDPASLDAIRALFARRNRDMPERNRIQAQLPAGTEAIPNALGTAPGVWMTALDATSFVALPGVPYEMKAMWDAEVVPRIRQRGWVRSVIVRQIVNLFGLGESEVEGQAMDLTVRGRVPEVGITASDATIAFRITGTGPTEADAHAQIAPTLAIIRERFGPYIVGEAEGIDVQHALLAELERRGLSLALAESCTGGLIAERITSIPGASRSFLGGVVSYSNAVKTSALGVPPDLLATRGAVSPEVAQAMAAGVRDRLGADVGLSVTGIAGPGGGTPEKPVGLVYLGLATASGVVHRELRLGSEQPRSVIQSRAAKHAMNWARQTIQIRDQD